MDSLDPRLHKVVIDLGTELLLLSGLTNSRQEASAKLNESLTSGTAAEYFERMVVELGGPSKFLSNTDKYLSKANVVKPYYANIDSYQRIASIDVRALGNVVVELGGGRKRAQDPVDHSVGLSAIKGIAAEVGPDQPVLMIHANSEQDIEKATLILDKAINYAQDVDNSASVSTNVVKEQLSFETLRNSASKGD